MSLVLKDIYKTKEIYKNVTSSNNVIPKYYDLITEDFRNKNNRDFSYWHPSTFGQCGLKNILEFYKVPGNSYVSLRQIEILKNGHSVHSKFQNTLALGGVLYGLWKCHKCKTVMGRDSGPYGSELPKKCSHCNEFLATEAITNSSGKVIVPPVPKFDYVELECVNSELNIRGNTDGVLKLSEQHEYQCIDFKTCSEFAYKLHVEKENCPISYHVVQLNAYMWLLNINSGYILYENRNKMVHKEFFIKKDNYIIERIINQVQYLNELIKHKKIPMYNDKNLISTDVGPEEHQCAGYPGFPPCKYYDKCFKSNFITKGGNILYHNFVKV